MTTRGLQADEVADLVAMAGPEPEKTEPVGGMPMRPGWRRDGSEGTAVRTMPGVFRDTSVRLRVHVHVTTREGDSDWVWWKVLAGRGHGSGLEGWHDGTDTMSAMLAAEEAYAAWLPKARTAAAEAARSDARSALDRLRRLGLNG